MAAFLGTLFLGVEIGIVMSVTISLVFVVYESAAPRTSVLGRLPGPIPVYRDAKQYPEARSVPGVLIFLVNAPIYFANVESVKEKLRKYEDYHVGKSFSWLHHHHSDSEEEEATCGGPTDSPTSQALMAGEAAMRADHALADMSLDGSMFAHDTSENIGVVRTWIDQEGHPDRVRFLVLDLSPVTSIDSSAVHAFKDIMTEYAERGIQMVFSNPNSDVLSTMRTSALIHDDTKWVFVRTEDAVRACVLAMKDEDIQAAERVTPRSSQNDETSA
jgi:MFS superfamily sulfate permease-like transporter